MDDQTNQVVHIQKKLINKYQFLRRSVQFVISVSIFSFFVWYSSGFSILPQCFNAYFSTYLFSMLTHTLERKYMFLICNGILAFLAKSSVLTTCSSQPISPFDENIAFQASNNLSESKTLVSEEGGAENGPPTVEDELEAEGTQVRENYEACIAEEDEEGGRGSGQDMVTQDDEYLGDTTMAATNEELSNTEELNRKFEEFIRKMKEEIRIEAQTQPIAAV